MCSPDEARATIVTAMIEDWLQQRMRTTPLCAGILFGGRSRRMGQPKHLLRMRGTTWLEHIVATVSPFVEQVVLLGGGEVPSSLRALPVLPDVPDRSGPLAGMLSAMRWRNGTSACWSSSRRTRRAFIQKRSRGAGWSNLACLARRPGTFWRVLSGPRCPW